MTFPFKHGPWVLLILAFWAAAFSTLGYLQTSKVYGLQKEQGCTFRVYITTVSPPAVEDTTVTMSDTVETYIGSFRDELKANYYGALAAQEAMEFYADTAWWILEQDCSRVDE